MGQLQGTLIPHEFISVLTLKIHMLGYGFVLLNQFAGFILTEVYGSVSTRKVDHFLPLSFHRYSIVNTKIVG